MDEGLPSTNGSVAVADAPAREASRASTNGAAPEAASRLGVLRHRHFRHVWMGAFGSAIGTWMEHVGVQWLMAEQTNSAKMMGYLALAQFGPMIALGPIGGLVADRVDRKKLLIVTQAIMMAIAGSLAAACAMGRATPGVLIVLMLLNGIATAFNVPAWQVLTPRLVPRDELPRAIALNGLQFNLARALGPALGGVVMAQTGATWLFVINTASFLGVILAVSGTPRPPTVRAAVGGKGVLADAHAQLMEAFGFVFGNKGPLCVFLGLVLFSTLAGGTVMRMLPLFVSRVYGAGESAYGVLLAVMGIGAVIGALGFKLVPQWYPRHHFIPLAIAGGGFSIAVFSAMGSFGPACAMMVVVGMFWIWAFNSSIAAMQMLVDDTMRGRVMSVMNMVVFGAAPVGALLAAWIGEALGGHTAEGVPTGRAVQLGVGLLALVLGCAGVVMLIWRTPEVDGIRPGEPGYDRTPGLWRGITAKAHRPTRQHHMDVVIDEAPGQELP